MVACPEWCLWAAEAYFQLATIDWQKEIEQKRRRKSKAQFFEMMREVRRYQQEEKDIAEGDQVEGGGDEEDGDDEEEDGREASRYFYEPRSKQEDEAPHQPEGMLPVEMQQIVSVDRHGDSSSQQSPPCSRHGHVWSKQDTVTVSRSNLTDPGTYDDTSAEDAVFIDRQCYCTNTV